MQYLWDTFNIKTFLAKTLVFEDGEFKSELSDFDKDEIKIQTLKAKTLINIKQKTEIPVHIIYVGNISGKQDIKIINSAEDTHIVISSKLNIKKPAFLHVFIENTGKNSEISADMVFLNSSALKLDVFADHLSENTGVFVKNRVLAHAGSSTNLYGESKIVGDCPGCRSDMSFTAMCAPDIKYIKMSPNQKIASIPESAEHSAGIYRGTTEQVQFLNEAGLSEIEVKNILEQAFLE
jgi:Fe-S cluster assembly scaffold protein SufB